MAAVQSVCMDSFLSAIPERLRDVFTTRCYTNPRLPYLTLPYLLNLSCLQSSARLASQTL